MLTQDEVLKAAVARADALARRDGESLIRLLHPKFCWISHQGERFDLDTYVRSNIGGQNNWHSQQEEDSTLLVAGHAGPLL